MRTSSSIDPSVLVVEDNPVNQDLCLRILQKLGCRTAAASSGLAALGILKEQAFDLVLMDCEMPGMDGFEATRRIRHSKPGSIAGTCDNRQRLPIIAITGHSASEMGDKHISAGMDDALCKPFSKVQLAELLKRWLPRHGADSNLAPGADAATEAATSGASRAEDIIDRMVLEETSVFEGEPGTALLKSLSAKFAAKTSRLIADLQCGLDARDAGEIGRLAHGLKSSAAALGFVRVAACCREIEALARNAKFATIETVVKRMHRELPAAMDALARLIADREMSHA